MSRVLLQGFYNLRPSVPTFPFETLPFGTPRGSSPTIVGPSIRLHPFKGEPQSMPISR